MGSDICLRNVLPEDLDALTRLSGAVGWPHRREDLSLMQNLGDGIAAVDRNDDAVTGIGFLWPIGAEASTLGLVIVDPAQQGKGIGRAIMTALLDRAGDRAIKLVATVSGRPLYEKLGFCVSGTIAQYQGTWRSPTDELEDIRPASRGDWRALLDIDHGALGIDRSDMIRALIDVGRVFVSEGAHGLTGYAICRPFGHGTVIGPIVAPDEETVLSLVRSMALPGFLRIDCLAEASMLRAALEDGGLVCVDQPVAMTKGDWPTASGPGEVFAIASQALG